MAEGKQKAKLEEKKVEKPVEGIKQEKETAEALKERVEDKKTEENKSEDKKKSTEKPKRAPKTEAVVNSLNAHLSIKTSAAICRFIVGKTVDKAIADLKEVVSGKKAVPMKGEIPHRHGKIMSGRFPKKAAEHFIKLLRTLAGNINVNGLEEPIIAEAVANIGNRPYGKFGAVRRKRAHVRIIAKNKSDWKKSRSKKAKMNKNKKANSKKQNKRQNKEKK